MNENPSQTVSTGNSPFKVWIPFREFASNIYQRLSVSIKQVLQVCYQLFLNDQCETSRRVTDSLFDFHESRASQSLGHDNASSLGKGRFATWFSKGPAAHLDCNGYFLTSRI